MIFNQIELGNLLKKKGNLNVEEANEEVEKHLEGEINDLLKEFEKSQSTQKEKKNKLPLVRLKTEYSGFDIIRIQRLEGKFRGKVANEGYLFELT